MRFKAMVYLAAAVPLAGAAPAPLMLPDRTLDCRLGRIVNFDPAKPQTDADLIIDGNARFVLFLPAIAVRKTPPPDAIDTPDPVDPRTRILADPDGLTAGFPPRFDRVVDLWPDRVELATNIDDPLVNAIVVSPIDTAKNVATIFMARATDVATFDTKTMYRGKCSIKVR